MKGKRNPFVAREGLPFIGVVLVLLALAWQLGGLPYSVPPLLLFAWLVLVFRDPVRAIPAVPLGVLCPVDGTVLEVSLTDNSALNGEAHRVLIRVNSLGTYTARSPSEGKVMDFRGTVPENAAIGSASGLWVQTDEGDDVILQFHGHRFGFAPLAFLGYGERIGQGRDNVRQHLKENPDIAASINKAVRDELLPKRETEPEPEEAEA